MYFLIIIFALIFVIAVLMFLYKKRPYLSQCKGVTLFPKYTTEITIPNLVLRERYPGDALDLYLVPYGFQLSKGNYFPLEYTRGKWHGDFSANHLGILIKFSEIHDYSTLCTVTIEAKWMALFDRGELYKILHSLKTDIEKPLAPIWKEGKVDLSKEHILIKEPETSEVLAYIEPVGDDIRVEFNKEASSAARKLTAEAEKQLNFYFGENQAEDAWEYAVYHCSSAANIYSPIRWVHIVNRNSL